MEVNTLATPVDPVRGAAPMGEQHSGRSLWYPTALSLCAGSSRLLGGRRRYCFSRWLLHKPPASPLDRF